jgi:hypothetical protein
MKKILKQYFSIVAHGGKIEAINIFIGLLIFPVVILLVIILYPLDFAAEWLNEDN